MVQVKRDPKAFAGIRRKWRPSLAFVIGGALFGELGLGLASFVLLRWISPVLGWKVGVTLAGMGLVIATLIATYLLWRLLVRPIRALEQASAELAHNMPDQIKPLEHYGTSELRDLGQNMLEMAQALQSKTLALRGYSDHVTHELKSPLTSIRAASELLETPGLDAKTQTQLTADIQTSANRMTDLLDAMRRFSKAQTTARSDETIALASLDCVRRQDVRLYGEPELLLAKDVAEAVVGNLITNAFQNGATRVDVCETDLGALIADDGNGISESDQNRIFDPFFTTRRDTGGTGMGLSIVRSLVESGGGAVALWPKKGGCVFDIRRPL